VKSPRSKNSRLIVVLSVAPQPVTQWGPTPYVTKDARGSPYTVFPVPAQPGQPGVVVVPPPAPTQFVNNQPVPLQYIPGTTIPGGPTLPPTWIPVTGTHTVPFSVCGQDQNGKQICTTLRTTAVACSVNKNGQQQCATSVGPVVQTVNAAPTGLAGRGMVGAALAGIAAVGAAVL
jgi:hypothetical protein